eukprot:scaffold214229_cov31-Prasinocladus_malaysianus.AAC.1
MPGGQRARIIAEAERRPPWQVAQIPAAQSRKDLWLLRLCQGSQAGTTEREMITVFLVITCPSIIRLTIRMELIGAITLDSQQSIPRDELFLTTLHANYFVIGIAHIDNGIS